MMVYVKNRLVIGSKYDKLSDILLKRSRDFGIRPSTVHQYKRFVESIEYICSDHVALIKKSNYVKDVLSKIKVYRTIPVPMGEVYVTKTAFKALTYYNNEIIQHTSFCEVGEYDPKQEYYMHEIKWIYKYGELYTLVCPTTKLTAENLYVYNYRVRYMNCSPYDHLTMRNLVDPVKLYLPTPRPFCSTHGVTHTDYYRLKSYSPYEAIHYLTFYEKNKKQYRCDWVDVACDMYVNTISEILTFNIDRLLYSCQLAEIKDYITIHDDSIYHEYLTRKYELEYIECSNNEHACVHPVIKTCGISNTYKAGDYNRTITTNEVSSLLITHTIKSITGKTEFDISSSGQVSVKTQNCVLPFVAIGYKIAIVNGDYAVVKLGLFKESIVAHENDYSFKFEGQTYTDAVYRQSKFRTNLCLVLGIAKLIFTRPLNSIKLDYTPQTARSCIFTPDFIYNVGDIIFVPDFNDRHINKVCLHGIHFFFDVRIAIAMTGIQTVGVTNADIDALNNYTFYNNLLPATIFDRLISYVTNSVRYGVTYNISSIVNTLMTATVLENIIVPKYIVPRINEFDEVECPICKEDFNDTSCRKITLRCGHLFCESCIINNPGGVMSMCPYCKQVTNITRKK